PGGIEALSSLLASPPPAFPAPLVLAQHLDPHHISHLPEILRRRSTLPVREVTGAEQLAPGTVFVTPPDRHVEITDRHVRVREQGNAGPKPSIDHLLSSAA